MSITHNAFEVQFKLQTLNTKINRHEVLIESGKLQNSHLEFNRNLELCLKFFRIASKTFQGKVTSRDRTPIIGANGGHC